MPPRRWALSLSALGATVSVVHSGRAALESLESFNPDTVLLDIGMPEMDGYEVSRRIRAIPDHRDVLLIALTGWGQEHDYRAVACRGLRPPPRQTGTSRELRNLLTLRWSETGQTHGADPMATR